MSVEQFGHHRVRHGNLMDGIGDLMQGEQMDLIYTDPPWGQGLITYWQTLNKKHTGAEPVQTDYVDFMKKTFEVLRDYAKDTVIFEYGIKWREDCINFAAEYGFKHGGVAPCFYKSGSKTLPLDIHVFSKSGRVVATEAYKAEVANVMGLKTVDVAFKHYGLSGGKVLDPMCGMGYTAQAAINNGMIFYGNELNSKRLEKTKDRLRRSL